MQVSEGLKKILWLAVKLGIAGGIIAYLLLRNPGQMIVSFENFNFAYLVPAMVAYGFHMVVCAWRWWRLARILGVELAPAEAFSITFQGYFFSLVIPGGAVGGDVVKMGIISRRSASGNRMEGMFTVLMDRIIGMIALFALALVLLGPAVGFLSRVKVPGVRIDGTALVILIGALCLAGLAASCVIFFHRYVEKLPFCGALMTWGDRVSHGMVGRLTAATDVYSKSWRELLVLVVVSVFLVHLMTVIPFGLLLAGLGEEVPVFGVVVAVTIGNIVGLIPLFPSGVGGRDLAVVTILATLGIGSNTADAAQLMYTAILIFFNLVGGIFFICDPGRRQLVPAADDN